MCAPAAPWSYRALSPFWLHPRVYKACSRAVPSFMPRPLKLCHSSLKYAQDLHWCGPLPGLFALLPCTPQGSAEPWSRAILSLSRGTPMYGLGSAGLSPSYFAPLAKPHHPYFCRSPQMCSAPGGLSPQNSDPVPPTLPQGEALGDCGRHFPSYLQVGASGGPPGGGEQALPHQALPSSVQPQASPSPPWPPPRVPLRDLKCSSQDRC